MSQCQSVMLSCQNPCIKCFVENRKYSPGGFARVGIVCLNLTPDCWGWFCCTACLSSWLMISQHAFSQSSVNVWWHLKVKGTYCLYIIAYIKKCSWFRKEFRVIIRKYTIWWSDIDSCGCNPVSVNRLTGNYHISSTNESIKKQIRAS